MIGSRGRVGDREDAEEADGITRGTPLKNKQMGVYEGISGNKTKRTAGTENKLEDAEPDKTSEEQQSQKYPCNPR